MKNAWVPEKCDGSRQQKCVQRPCGAGNHGSLGRKILWLDVEDASGEASRARDPHFVKILAFSLRATENH